MFTMGASNLHEELAALVARGLVVASFEARRGRGGKRGEDNATVPHTYIYDRLSGHWEQG